MKLKNYKILFFLLFSVSCMQDCNSQNLNKSINSDNISKITINYVDFDTQTTFRIDCKHFYTYFSNSFKTQEISDCRAINKFIEFLNKSNNDNLDLFPIDVRFRIKIYYLDETIKVICGSESVIEIDGRIQVISECFLNYLFRLGIY